MRRLINAAIVVVVLGTAGALVLPAIAKVRGAAARTQCQNNLKQIVMGLQNYSDSCGAFPCATVPNEDLACGERLSWLVDTLPFITQVGLVIDRKKGWQHKENIIPKWHGSDGLPNPPAPLGEMKLFRCPADTTASDPDRPGLSNYVGNSGVGAHSAELPLGYPGVGFFGCQRKLKQEEIKDGSANTIAVLETNWKVGPWTAGGFPTVRSFDPASTPYLGVGRPFGSGHRDITLAAFADSSVHSLAKSISPEILEALATIAGGEKTEPLVD
jgi:hypothetical protein